MRKKSEEIKMTYDEFMASLKSNGSCTLHGDFLGNGCQACYKLECEDNRHDRSNEHGGGL